MEAAIASAAILAGGRRLRERRLIAATEGNLSVRLEDGTLLVTPSKRRKDELEAADLEIVPLDAQRTGSGSATVSSDIRVHRAIYGARPDVTAVVHAHVPAAMALTLAGEIPDPAMLPEMSIHLPVLPFVPYATMGSEELAVAIVEAITEHEPGATAAVLERHGAIAVGTDQVRGVEQAVDRLELVEVLCRTILDALVLRAAEAIRRGPVEPP